MKNLTVLLTVFLANTALAHEGHASYGSLFHEFEHALWMLAGLILVLACAYFLLKDKVEKLSSKNSKRSKK